MTERPEPTHAGFVSNYPPFAAWTAEALPQVAAHLDTPPTRDVPLGAYVHIPFCRKRCRFCYFKVHTDVPASTVRDTVSALTAEARLWSSKAVVRDRPLDFLYVGGGTPSYLSRGQLRELFDGLQTHLPWRDTISITFEAEPGTVRPEKLQLLRDMGVDRLSMGVETFQPRLLEINGRAHGAPHIQAAFDMAHALDFPHLNLDLIAGLVGATDADWDADIEATIALAPTSVTIYQLENPPNTWISKQLRQGETLALADDPTKRQWVARAFERLEAAGYTVTRGYTAVKHEPAGSFAYRDLLWRGADLIPLGVSAFGHLQGTHLQNQKRLEVWSEQVQAGQFSWSRGYTMTPRERLIREVVLQLKLGTLALDPIENAHGVRLAEVFAGPLQHLVERGLLHVEPGRWRLTREALLRVDALLPAFFLAEHGGPPPEPTHVA